MKKRILILITVLAIILTSVFCLVGCEVKDSTQKDNVQENTSADTPIYVHEEIVNKSKMSAVCIYSSNFKGIRVSSGSGFIISNDGYVVTNYHVVKGYSYFEVIVIDEDNKTYTYDATIVKSSSNPDIAVLKIKSSKYFQPIRFAKSSEVNYGDPCVMIGNPKGIGFMSARAMVANPNVKIDGINYVAIDAPVNPGNSGGALINANCEVIAVITSRYTSSGTVNDVVMDIGFGQKTEDVVKFLKTINVLSDWLSYWS